MPAPRKLLSCLIPMLAVAVVTAPAAGASTTFGNACVGNATAGATLTQLSQTTGSLPLTAPQSGVITSWGTAIIPYGGGLSSKLKVLHPTGAPNTFQVTAESTVQPVVSGVNSFPAQIPIQAGDKIGAFGTPATLYCSGGAAGDVIGVAPGDQALGTTTAYTPSPNAQVPLTATIEADADGDGFGDETQDKCPQSAALQVPCPVLTLDAIALPATATTVQILVVTDAQSAITVSASAKVPKGKKGKGTVVTQLTPVVQLVEPGRFFTYTLNFTKPLKDALAKLPRKKSINLDVVAEGKSLAGPPASDRFTVKLKGRAKPRKPRR
jgi:hypothetical protein